MKVRNTPLGSSQLVAPSLLMRVRFSRNKVRDAKLTSETEEKLMKKE